MEDEESLKLYIKASCSVCLNAHRKGVFVNCPYCDVSRKQVIEASFNTVKDILKETLDSKQKKELIKFLKEK
tara:strand:+ start:3661 stop:3876 length:216 start_codon:yes stop_codon:yes gene_type:complete